MYLGIDPEIDESFLGPTSEGEAGIWIWNRPFMIPDPQKEDNKRCILFMYTRGVLENDPTDKISSKIYYLSTILSSYQVCIVKDQLPDAMLGYLSLFSDYGMQYSQMNRVERKAPFYQLDFLVHTYSKFSEDSDFEQYKIEMEEYKTTYLSSQNAGNPNQENKTNNPFEEIDVFCFPSMMESFDNSFGSNSFSSVSTTFLMYFESYVNEHLLSHIYSLKVDNQMIDPDGYLS